MFFFKKKNYKNIQIADISTNEKQEVWVPNYSNYSNLDLKDYGEILNIMIQDNNTFIERNKTQINEQEKKLLSCEKIDKTQQTKLIEQVQKIEKQIINSKNGLLENLQAEGSYNPLPFMPNWLSSTGSFGWEKWTLLFRLCRQQGVFQCITFQQTFIKMLYDGYDVIDHVLTVIISLCFNNILFYTRDTTTTLDTKKVSILKRTISQIILYSELTGGTIASVEQTNNDICIKYDESKKKEIDKNEVLFTSTIIPQGVYKETLKPYHFSFLEKTLYQFETINILRRNRNEIINRLLLTVLKIEGRDSNDNSIVNKLTAEERDVLFKKAKEIANSGFGSLVTLPYGIDLQHLYANLDISNFHQTIGQILMEITHLPTKIWEGENRKSLFLNSSLNEEENDLLNTTLDKYRSHYEEAILLLAKKYFARDDVLITYQDQTTKQSVNETKSIEQLANTIATLSGDYENLQQITEIKQELLNRVKEICNKI